MKIIKCHQERLKETATLFNAYRMFYGQESDVDAVYAFLKENLDNDRSVLFLLIDEDDHAVAFTQLYPSFCSVEMKPIYYLYDLYVDVNERGKGHSKLLMSYVTDYFKKEGVKRLTLDTALSNKVAQNLYESIGYEKESEFITYHYRF